MLVVVQLLLFGAIPVSGLSVVLFVVFLAVGLLIWLPLSRRLGWQPASTLALLVSIAVMLTITLHPGADASQAAPLTSCLQLAKQQVRTDLMTVAGDHRELISAAVMVPVGFFAVTAARSGPPAVAIVLILPGLIELAQLKITGRDCNAASFLLTGLGGLIGVAIGLAVVHIARTADR
jgi:hypothetical protein